MTEITIRFQIKHGTPTLPEKPYPIDDAALMAAATAPRVRLGPNPGQRMISNWRDLVLRNVDSTLRDIVAGKTLDELFEPTDPYRDPREEIRRELLVQLSKKLGRVRRRGTGYSIGTFQAGQPRGRTAKVDHLAGHAPGEDRVKAARGEAQALLTRESAYAYAQLEMMLAIDRGFRRLVIDGQNLTSKFVALRFIEMLRRRRAEQTLFCSRSRSKPWII